MISSQFERVYDTLTRSLSPALAARFDLMRPSLRFPWGGPMNGQDGRQAIVKELLKVVAFAEVVETGTFRGSTTEFLAQASTLPVTTVEAVPRNYEYAKQRLNGFPTVRVSQGDSRDFLRQLSANAAQAPVLFYLDAHWAEDLPLGGELEIIERSWAQAVVLVDDFEVPGDPGYGFDDYGKGKSLDHQLLDRSSVAGWDRFAPVLPSARETGERRGCVVIAAPAVSALVEGANLLRLVKTPPIV